MDTKDTEIYHTADIQFHTAIVSASANSVLSQVYESSKYMFFKLPAFWRLFAHHENAKLVRIGSGLQGHQRIFEAIESRDADLAGNLMFEHLDDVQQSLLGSIGGLQFNKTNQEAI